MSSEIGFVYVSGGGLVLTLKGHPYQIHQENQHLDEIWRILEDEPDMSDSDKETALLALVKSNKKEILESVSSFGFDDVTIEHGLVIVDGQEIHNSLTNKILELYEAGRNCDALVNFMANLSDNPSKASQDQLFDFLDTAGFPITSDGCFLSYKGVKHDYWDKYTGSTFKYEPGKVIEMPREKVCADPNQACAAGIHVGTIDYAKGFASTVILLKVNPRDAVSVPNTESQKLRVCRCEVVRLYESTEVLSRPVYDDEDIEDDNFLEADEDYRKMAEEGTTVSVSTFDQLFAKYSKMTRDDVCREGASQGMFLSTNEARDMGKEFVIVSLANQGLPYNVTKVTTSQLAKLAVRRGLFTSQSAACKRGRPTVVAKLQEDVEQRLMASA